MQSPVKLVGALILALLVATAAQAADVTVAAASDLSVAIKEIIANFEKSTGHKVRLTLGSSGNFYAQISNGAPFEVFLSADVNYPRQLEPAGRTEPGSIYTYAIGRIVVWVSAKSKLDPQKTQMKTLLDPSIRKISIANQLHAPYGRAAESAMKHAGVYDSVQAKLVFAENISQAAQFIQSGAADVGIIALSLARSAAGRFWEIPADMYPRMEQGAVLIKGASPAARSFHEWLRRPDSREILSRSGFGLP